MLVTPMKFAITAILAVWIAVSTISCNGSVSTEPVSTDPATYVGRYKLINADPDRSDLPSGVELRSDMSVVEFFGDERAEEGRPAGRWHISAHGKDDVEALFLERGHPIRIRDGEIRLYLNFDLDSYFVKSDKQKQ
jgi:hypothetical protein